MNAKLYTTLSTIALLLDVSNALAQTAPAQPPPAPPAAPQAPRAAVAPAATPAAAAPAAPAPRGATPAATPAPVGPAGATAPPGAATADGGAAATTISPREAPAARNQVSEAFTPKAGGLTANQVAKRAVASSHTIAAKQAELRAAAAEVDSAMYQFIPKVTLKASYTRLSRVVANLGNGYSLGASSEGPYEIRNVGGQDVLVGPDGNPVMGGRFSFPVIRNSYSLSAALSVPLSDYVLRMSNSIEGTKENREAAELNIKAERQKAEGDARVAFFNWARAIGQVAVTEKSIDRVRARLKDAQASFTVGLVTKAEVLRLEAQVAATEAGLESARGFRDLAAQQLAVIMNEKQAEYDLGEDVLGQPAKQPIEPLDKLVEEALSRRLELQALAHTAESLDKAESVVRAGALPRLDGFADYTYANPNQRYMFDKSWHGTWSAGVMLSWSPNDTLTNSASGNKYKANRETVEANRRALAQGVRMEVTTAYTDGRRAAAELEAAKRSAEASQAAYDTSIQLYKVGKATTAELIDSEAELVNSNLRLINAHIDTKVAETKLARALGRDMTRVGE
ncbi:MAG: TolC family protein [Polyangiaceae bacterium]